MPCNSDYMNPTADERAALIGHEKELKDVCDKMTYNADQMRELILAGNGKMDNLSVDQITLFFTLRTEAEQLHRDAVNPFDNIHRNYAFSMGNKNSSVLNLFEKVSEESRFVASVAQKMLDRERVSLAKIKTQQIKHRKGDIQRLIKHFAGKNDFEMVVKLASVDFTLPLEPQIGFDPDKY